MDYYDQRNYSSYLRRECWCQIGRKSVDSYIQPLQINTTLNVFRCSVSAHSVAPGLAGSYRDHHLNSFLPSPWFYPQELHEVLKRVSVWE